MKHHSFIYAFTLSLCLTSIQATEAESQITDRDVHRTALPSLRDGNGYVRYLAAQKFSMLASAASDAVHRRLIGDLIYPYINNSAPTVRWETTKALVVLASKAENADERWEVQERLWVPLGDEDSTVNQEAAKGMLILVEGVTDPEELQSLRKSLALRLKRERNYRVLYTIAQMFEVLATRVTEVKERRLIALALCSGFLKPHDWRVVEVASHSFKTVYEAAADSNERLQMEEILATSLDGKNNDVRDLALTYWGQNPESS